MYSKFLQKNTKLLKESKRKAVKKLKKLSESIPAYKADIEAYSEKYLQSVIDDFCDNYSTPDLARAVFDACGDSAMDALIEAKGIYNSRDGMAGGYAGMVYYNDTVAFFDDNEDDIIDLVNNSGFEELYTQFGKDYFENGPDYAKNNITWFVFDEIVRDFFDNVELDDSGLAD